MTHIGCTCNRLKEAEWKAVKWDAIVRCKDCLSWERKCKDRGVCEELSVSEEGHSRYTGEADFCSLGASR